MKPHACLEASSATAFSNNVATCPTKFNNNILFTEIVFIALHEKASNDLRVPKVMQGLLQHRVSHSCVLGKKGGSRLMLMLKMVHQTLPLPALGLVAAHELEAHNMASLGK